MTIDFWNIVAKTADVLGIVSFLLTIITLLLTSGIRKSLKKQIEKNAYVASIEAHLNDLQACYATMSQDPKLYNEVLLDHLYDVLDEIVISYENFLPKEIVAKINKLIERIRKLEKDINNQQLKRDCKEKLHEIVLRLRKEKDLI